MDHVDQGSPFSASAACASSDTTRLGGGISGAVTYLVRLPGGEALLKRTDQASGQMAWERARREVRFYREIAPLSPLSVPEVLGSYQDEEQIVLALRAYRRPPPVQDWNSDLYCKVFRHAAILHSQWWGHVDELDAFSWLGSSGWRMDEEHRATALEVWSRVLRSGPLPTGHFRYLVSSIEGLLEKTEVILRHIRALPETLSHGDFHAANILCDREGTIVLADWHEVRRARGPEDLAQFLTRAIADGSEPPEAKMLEEYRDELEGRGVPIPKADISRAMEAAELLTIILYWPHYLVAAPDDRVGRLIARMVVLADRLALSVPSSNQVKVGRTMTG